MTTTQTPIAPPKIGDFFYSSWGYDQTNIDFYKVVGLTASGKSVRVQKWTSRIVTDNGPYTEVVPGEVAATVTVWVDGSPMSEIAPVMTKRMRPTSDRWSITISDTQWAWSWDGKPKYETGGGFGH